MQAIVISEDKLKHINTVSDFIHQDNICKEDLDNLIKFKTLYVKDENDSIITIINSPEELIALLEFNVYSIDITKSSMNFITTLISYDKNLLTPKLYIHSSTNDYSLKLDDKVTIEKYNILKNYYSNKIKLNLDNLNILVKSISESSIPRIPIINYSLIQLVTLISENNYGKFLISALQQVIREIDNNYFYDNVPYKSLFNIISIINFENDNMEEYIKEIFKSSYGYFDNMIIYLTEEIFGKCVDKCVKLGKGTFTRIGFMKELDRNILDKYSKYLDENKISITSFKKIGLEPYMTYVYKKPINQKEKKLIKKLNYVFNLTGQDKNIAFYIVLTIINNYSLEELKEMNKDAIYYTIDFTLRSNINYYYTSDYYIGKVSDTILEKDKFDYLLTGYLTSKRQINSFMKNVINLGNTLVAKNKNKGSLVLRELYSLINELENSDLPIANKISKINLENVL